MNEVIGPVISSYYEPLTSKYRPRDRLGRIYGGSQTFKFISRLDLQGWYGGRARNEVRGTIMCASVFPLLHKTSKVFL